MNTHCQLSSFTMLAKPAASSKTIGRLQQHVAPCATSASRFSNPSSSRQQRRNLATVQDAPPKRTHGNLPDQDRIFTNLYGHHGADLKSAMKYGDWHKTKEIVQKGHDWVRSILQWMVFVPKFDIVATDHLGDQSIRSTRPRRCWFPLGHEMGSTTPPSHPALGTDST